MQTSPADHRRLCSLSVFAVFVAVAAIAIPGRVVAQTTPAERPETVPPAATVTEAVPQYLRVEGDRVNLRTRADINSRIVGRAGRGTVLEVIGREYEWYRVQPTPDVYSLVSARYIKRSGGDRGTVQVDTTLRVRVGSDVQPRDPLLAEVQTLLETGAEVRIVGALDDEWLKIAPPAGVGFYVHQDYAAPIDAAEAQRLMAQQPAHPAPPAALAGAAEVEQTTETPTSPPPDPSTDDAGRWEQRMAAALEAIKAEEQKPAHEQNWEGYLPPLKRIAAQEEDADTARLASAWVARIEQRMEARRTEPRTAVPIAELPPAEAEVGPIARTRTPAGFDARGILRPSFAVPIGPYGLRYKLEHATTKRVTGYAEFPPELGVDVGALVGKYVGIRGEKRQDEQTGIEIIRVRKLTVLGGTPAEMPARPALVKEATIRAGRRGRPRRVFSGKERSQ